MHSQRQQKQQRQCGNITYVLRFPCRKTKCNNTNIYIYLQKTMVDSLYSFFESKSAY